jgi:hypothetical protein
MKKIVCLLILFTFAFLSAQEVYSQTEKPRVVVMTDGEVDDRCSMIRFLLYTNDVELLAIIRTNSVFQRRGWSTDKWIEQQIDAYEKIHPNLIVHDPGYPPAGELREKLCSGDEDSTHIAVDFNVFARMPGMTPLIDPAGWADTPGSDRIVGILLDANPAKVYIQAWGGGNTAARAFHKLKERYPDDYDRAVSKAIMYNIWYQDGAGSYIEKHHPKVTMLLSHHFSGTWNYESQRYTDHFVEDYLHNGHGPLAALYAQNYISEGDSPAFFYSLANGLRAHEHPAYGGWGGCFYKVDGLSNVYRDVDRGSYLRWIEAANRDFEARLNWCIAGRYGDANHRPVINTAGMPDKTVRVGDTVTLKAEITETDPPDVAALWTQYVALYEQQGMDRAGFSSLASTFPKYSVLWWQYREAGTYNGVVPIPNPVGEEITFIAPDTDRPVTIHLILEVTDKGSPALAAYARAIITVIPK